MKALTVTSALEQRFSWRYCQKQRILPRRQEGNLLVVTCPQGETPRDRTLQVLSQTLGCDVWVEYVELPEWEHGLDSLYGNDRSRTDRGVPEQQDLGPPGGDDADEASDRDALDRMARQAPVVALVNELCRSAIIAGASDLHLECRQRSALARMRVDGHLLHLRDIDRRLYGALASRIKVMANLNIMERRLPQDGRLRFDLGPKRVDLRVSIIPGSHGESFVLRLLGSEDDVPLLQELGMKDTQERALEEACAGAGGMILLAGPTGSGKSSTLHSLLCHCRNPGVRILALEDPVERTLDGITQIQVNEDGGLGFGTLLRRVLRHDPDVIMVGEIRDEETAALAFRAALTGHLVLSTVHADSALGALDRLRGLGVDPSVLASGLKVLASQRLVRKLCTACRKKLAPGSGARVLPGMWQGSLDCIYEAAGCPECGGTGYAGRTALWEVLPVDDGLAGAIMDGQSSRGCEACVDRVRFPSLETAALQAIRNGVTSAPEIWREVLG